MAITLLLFGTLELRADGRSVEFATAAARALLAYLAAESDRAHSRERLATLLWPEQSQAAALTNLRQTLARLRKALPNPHLLDVSNQTLQFNAAQAPVDLLRFEALLAQVTAHNHNAATLCPVCVSSVQEAISLYRDAFLQGFYLKGSDLFDEWLLFKREQLHRQMLWALDLLTSHHEAAGDYAEMQMLAYRQIALEPWHEEAHAQLMRALAYQGERVQALAQFDTLSRTLNSEMGMLPSAETVALYERIRAGELAATEPTSPPHNLPAQLTPFVARASDIAAIWEMLQQRDVRLLTLTGAGGMGKTRLAIEVGRTYADQYADGIYFVALAALASPAAIAPAISDALSVPLRGADPWQEIAQFLRDKQMLLIVDNFEHLLAGADRIVALLQAAPRLTILATSRESLSVRGEQLYRVRGLAYESLAEGGETAAALLFAQSARRVRPNFHVTETTLPAIQRICALVQGMPLALELAAAWVDMLSLDDIAAKIISSADFLATAWRDAPERQRSIRSVFNWSWQLLDEPERNAFSQLAIFQGAFTLEAAQAVVGDVLPILRRLIHKSLLQLRATSDGHAVYEMHALLRQLAYEQLDATGHLDLLRERHATYFLNFVAERETRLHSDGVRDVLRDLRLSLDEVRQAWAWAAANGKAQLLANATITLSRLLSIIGLSQEGVVLFRFACEQLRLSAQTAADRAALSSLLAELSRHLCVQTHYAEALTIAQEALDLAQTTGNVSAEIEARLQIGSVLIRQGQYAVLQGVAEETLRLAVKSGSDYLETSSIMQLGTSYHYRALYTQATVYLEQALRRAERADDPFTQLNLLSILGGQLEMQGRFGAALAMRQRALQISERLGFSRMEGSVYNNLGGIYLYMGAYDPAKMYLEKSVRLARQIGYHDDEAYALDSLIQLYHALGLFDDAFACAKQALRYALETDDHHLHPIVLAHYGYLLVEIGRLDEAIATYKQAQTLVMRRQEAAGPLFTECQAFLAQVYLLQQQIGLAQEVVDAVLHYIDTKGVIGMFEVSVVYWICYRVLRANGDARAWQVLESAHQLVQWRAEQIDDVALRRVYLENILVHCCVNN